MINLFQKRQSLISWAMWKHKGNQLQFPGPSWSVLAAVRTAAPLSSPYVSITAATSARLGFLHWEKNDVVKRARRWQGLMTPFN